MRTPRRRSSSPTCSPGMSTLFGTPILRSLFLIGSFMFVAFGLWNVLLLPFSITVLGATEFEYGLQEGLTSVGFVIGSLFMARFAGRLPEPVWIVISLVGHGDRRDPYGLSTTVPVAILLVAISGFLQPPSSVSRAVLLQRNTPREMRGRVFSAFYVMRDVIFLIGMAGAGLADVVRHPGADRRRVVASSSSPPLVTVFAPGLGYKTWGAAAARLRTASAAAGAAAAVRPATLADVDRLVGRIAAFGRLSPEMRADAGLVRDGPRGPGRDPDRRARRRRDPGVLHPRRLDHRGRPGRGRLSRPLDDGRRRLLRRDRGADRQHADRRRRRRRRHDAPRGPGRDAPRDDGGPRDRPARAARRSRPGSRGRRPRTCRASPASTSPTCATCGRRGRPPRPLPRTYADGDGGAVS